MTDRSWMPEAADVVAWGAGSRDSQSVAQVSAFSRSESIATRQAHSFDTGHGPMQIPELRQESFCVANLGDRICSLAACNAESSADVVCAAGVASPATTQVSDEEWEGGSSIQVWLFHPDGGATCQFELTHEGAKTDALAWCPAREAFPAPADKKDLHTDRTGLLLAVCSNTSVCIWAIPKQVLQLKPAEAANDGQCKLALRPKVTIGRAQLAQQAPTAAAWSPHPPCNQLLIGTSNGNVAIMDLHGAGSPSAPGVSPVSVVHIGGSTIRCLAWSPCTATSTHEDGASTCFAVAAGQGQTAVLDCDEPQTVVLDLSLGGPGSSANGMLWLPGAGCSILALGTQAGQLRRVPMAQAASLSLFANLAKPIDGVCALAYSHALKLIGYSTGGGLVAVLACAARVNVKAMASRGQPAKARIIPNAAVCQMSYEHEPSAGEGQWTCTAGVKAKLVAPAETATGLRSCDEKRAGHAKEDALKLAHPWASIPWLAMVDSVDVEGRPSTTCIFSTSGSLLVASRVTHT
eukprot:jgi/Ulvmu1/6200/UM028_0056.1